MTFSPAGLTIEDIMYRRPKFLEVLIMVREEMAREADYDVDLFAEMARGGRFSVGTVEFDISSDGYNASRKEKKSSSADRKKTRIGKD